MVKPRLVILSYTQLLVYFPELLVPSFADDCRRLAPCSLPFREKLKSHFHLVLPSSNGPLLERRPIKEGLLQDGRD